MIGEVRAGRGHDQDLLSDGLEIAPEMDRAFEGQDLLRAGLDAQMAEDGLVGRLLLSARHNDPQAFDFQQYHGTQIHMIASIDRPRRGETPIAQTLNRETPRQGLAI